MSNRFSFFGVKVVYRVTIVWSNILLWLFGIGGTYFYVAYSTTQRGIWRRQTMKD
jgi:hypothetical protein